MRGFGYNLEMNSSELILEVRTIGIAGHMRMDKVREKAKKPKEPEPEQEVEVLPRGVRWGAPHDETILLRRLKLNPTG